MSLKLLKLQESDKESRKIRVKGVNAYKKVDGILHYKRLFFMPEVIQTELISQYYNNFLASHFDINEMRELIGWKYYWLSFKKNIKTYVKGYDDCLALKVVRHKPYSDLHLLPISTHQWKDLLMDFVIRLLISINWKRESYNFILVIID